MPKIIPRDYQVEEAKKGFEILKNYGIVFYAWEERTGKTVTVLETCEQATKTHKVLIITTKKALPDWLNTLNNYEGKNIYHVTNYHQALKVMPAYTLVVLDECHNYLPAFPKPGKIWKEVKPLTVNVPIIYSSATPHAQGKHQLFHLLQLSSFSPWKKYRNGYAWHAEYGIPHIKYIPHPREQYDKVDDDKVWNECKHLFLFKTRKELNFPFEPEDVVHYIDLEEDTKKIYNTILKESYYKEERFELVCDSPMKVRTSLHMLEGGVAKVDDDYYTLENNEKIDYIKKHWGDTEDLIIMFQYKEEGRKLAQHFKHAEILQATSYAEGIERSQVEHLVIYSQDFKAAKHNQRRARQASKDRKTEIKVHFLLVKKGISEEVYDAVSIKKTNYIDKMFERRSL